MVTLMAQLTIPNASKIDEAKRVLQSVAHMRYAVIAIFCQQTKTSQPNTCVNTQTIGPHNSKYERETDINQNASKNGHRKFFIQLIKLTTPSMRLTRLSVSVCTFVLGLSMKWKNVDEYQQRSQWNRPNSVLISLRNELARMEFAFATAKKPKR